MEAGNFVDAIAVAVIWMLRELAGSVWKHKDGYSIGDKISYLFKREKARENVEDFLSKHPRMEEKDD